MTAAKHVRAKPVNRLNDLVAKEWVPETVSVWVQRGLGKGHEHAQIERLHPAPFSFQDVARLVRFFTKAGETILDRYYMFHSDLAREMQQRGFTLKGLKILYQRHKRVFPYGFPYSYVPNLHHQYIVILAK